MNLQETYELRDSIKYDSNIYIVGGTSQQYQLNYELPSSFTVEMTAKTSASDNNFAYITIGETTTNAIVVGHTSSRNGANILIRYNNSYVKQSSFIPVTNYQDVKIIYSYDNGSHSLSLNNQTVTLSDSSINPVKIILADVRNNTFKDLTIMLL